MRTLYIKIGAGTILFLMLIALTSPIIAPHDPEKIDLEQELSGATMSHPLGQDKLGRDILSRILYGARISIMVGFAVVGISLAVGVSVGSIAGYVGGTLDTLIMSLIDILLAFPGILLAIAITGILGPSLNHVILSLCIMGWVGYARIVRAQILSIREREYILAAKALGLSPCRIIFRHILPNTLSPVIVEATFGIAGAILAESSLSFLGLGPQDVPTWGGMLNEGVDFLLFAPHVATFPGLAIMITVMGFNFLGDGLRDHFDPRKQNRPA
ncbi:MAG: ABC transporter permease [Pseudomonadota bacterium]